MDTKISCSAKTCYYNVNEMCIAKSIHVVGENAYKNTDTDCNTFIEKEDIYGTSHFTNRNLTDEFKQLFTNDNVEMKPEIICEARNCVYNVNKVCGASEIIIHGPAAGSSSETQCQTFKE